MSLRMLLTSINRAARTASTICLLVLLTPIVLLLSLVVAVFDTEETQDARHPE